MTIRLAGTEEGLLRMNNCTHRWIACADPSPSPASPRVCAFPQNPWLQAEDDPDLSCCSCYLWVS